MIGACVLALGVIMKKKHFRQTKNKHPRGNTSPLSLCTAAIEESQKFGIDIPRTRLPQQKRVHLETTGRLCGPMDKARVYGTRDSRFDPWQSQ